MKLEQQVCSLKLAQKLKELGVKQESLFYWVSKYKPLHHEHSEITFGNNDEDDISAFSCSELGEMLPHEIVNGLVTLKGTHNVNVYLEDSTPQKGFVADTEADARAKMLMYLLENGLITR